MKALFDVIKRPVVSEKSTIQNELSGVYTFKVAASSSKQEIKEAVEKAFGVDVVSVRTMLVHGKVKRTARAVFKRPNWKKAIVSVKDGQKIELFQGA